ncbi:MAG: amylo-alpha-1,6-glucosidase [Spirochaetes bacterium]|nr:amylo-alpha-1,6-glucosidase [Spirochaetota bacterium]
MELMNLIEGKIKESFYHEWLISNILGSYGLGTGNLIPNRKYHGLLIANINDNKFHILSSIEERVKILSESMYLDSNQYPDIIYPNGYRHLVKSWLLPFPTFLYSSYPFDENVLILKIIQMDEEKNLVRINYKNYGTVNFKLYLRPKFTFRNHHSLNKPGSIKSEDIEINLKNEKQVIIFHKNSGNSVFLLIDNGVIRSEPLIYKNIFYPNEEIRGYDSLEDLYAPIIIKIELQPDEEINLFFMLEDELKEFKNKIEKENKSINLNDLILKRFDNSFNRIIKEKIIPVDYPIKMKKKKVKSEEEFKSIFVNLKDDDEFIFNENERENILKLMLSRFMLKDDIIAGFPWFGNWGRDTMITLEALNFEEDEDTKNFYLKVLLKYGKKLKNGLIPNVIDKDGFGENYNSIDASLLFCNRIYDYITNFKEENEKNINLLIKYFIDVIFNYFFNKDLPFEYDKEDSLIKIKPDCKLALTWMDAKIYDYIVTPRFHKPIEIQFLFYNSLKNLLKLLKKYEIEIPKKYSKLGKDFVNEVISKLDKNLINYYFDGEIFGDTIYNKTLIKEIRPNYLIGLSLENVSLSNEIYDKAIIQADKYLVTDYGLRTLNKENPSFRKKYIGNQKMRDMAYHQGTVWAWLILPFSKILYKRYKDKKIVKEEILKRFRRPFDGLLKGHYGSIAEVWDGDEPHFPKGAPAQAWSVAAYYYVVKNFF